MSQEARPPGGLQQQRGAVEQRPVDSPFGVLGSRGFAAAVGTAGHVSQGTTIEQTRAVAEVQAAIVAAKTMPRNEAAAVAAMRATCGHRALADRAMFRYKRGGSQISGPSVHLARELARCWGNMSYGITELSRDYEARQSEMVAFAVDLETNVRATTTFIVPMARDARGAIEPIEDLRSIYENAANMGARRVREMIFSMLPVWFREEALDLIADALKRTEPGKTLAQEAASAIAFFADRWAVTVGDLEAKLGRKSGQWVGGDLGTLRVIRGSLDRGETTVADEFGSRTAPDQVTAAEITQQAAGASTAAAPVASPATPTPPDDPAPPPLERLDPTLGIDPAGPDPWAGNNNQKGPRR